MSVVFIHGPNHRAERRIINALSPGRFPHVRLMKANQSFAPGTIPGMYQLAADFCGHLNRGDFLVCWVELLHRFDPEALIGLANLIERLTRQPIVALSDNGLELPAKPLRMHVDDIFRSFVPINLVAIGRRMSSTDIAESVRKATWELSHLGTVPRRELPSPELEEVAWCFRGGELYHVDPICDDSTSRGEKFPIYINDASRIGRVGCGCCSTSGCHPALLPEWERRWLEDQAEGRQAIAVRVASHRACPVRPAPGFSLPKRKPIR